VVNPNIIQAQITAALYGAITLKDGRVEQATSRVRLGRVGLVDGLS
jgi:hypothetical protein